MTGTNSRMTSTWNGWMDALRFVIVDGLVFFRLFLFIQCVVIVYLLFVNFWWLFDARMTNTLMQSNAIIWSELQGVQSQFATTTISQQIVNLMITIINDKGRTSNGISVDSYVSHSFHSPYSRACVCVRAQRARSLGDDSLNFIFRSIGVRYSMQKIKCALHCVCNFHIDINLYFLFMHAISSG